jgi:hypothetical protein
MLGLVLVKRLIGAQLQPVRMPHATPRSQHQTFTTHLKRLQKERFVLYVRRLLSIPYVSLIELYNFFRLFWLFWVCWSIIFFVFINWIFNLLILAISKKYDL